MSDLVHPELSCKIVGALYRVYNELGGGYQENIYQKAVKKELIRSKIGFIEQVDTQLQYLGATLHSYRLDFIVEHKIVLELKVAPKFTQRDISQVLGYLKQSKLELGILASMNRNGIIFKRILRGRER